MEATVASRKPTPKAVYQYLDELQEDGRTNMFGAVPFLRARWLKMSDETAMRYVVEWMDDKKKEEEV